MQWGKHRENVVRRLPRGLRGNQKPKFLWRNHDALYIRTRQFELRLMKPKWLGLLRRVRRG